MPDGDIFQRSLWGTGKGWGSVFRLCANRNSFDGLEGNISRAVADNVRRIPRDVLEQTMFALNTALDAESATISDQRAFHPNNLLRLEQELSLIRSTSEFELMKILKDSAKSVFVAYQSKANSLSHSDISDALFEMLVCRIFDSRASRVHDVLINASGRSINEQYVMETELKKRIRPIGQKLAKDFCHGKSFRSPTFKRAGDKKSVADLLNQPIQVLSLGTNGA